MKLSFLKASKNLLSMNANRLLSTWINYAASLRPISTIIYITSVTSTSSTYALGGYWQLPVYHSLPRSPLLRPLPLNNCCCCAAVKFDKVKFLQKRGIPQGLNVSGVLCSFYFAVLEEEATRFLRETPNNTELLMRLTDDYLFITTDQTRAKQLLEELIKSGAKNGFELNMNKIQTNCKLLPAAC